MYQLTLTKRILEIMYLPSLIKTIPKNLLMILCNVNFGGCFKVCFPMAIRNKPARQRMSPWAAVNSTRATKTEHSYSVRENILQTLMERSTLQVLPFGHEKVLPFSLKCKLFKKPADIDAQVKYGSINILLIHTLTQDHSLGVNPVNQKISS